MKVEILTNHSLVFKALNFQPRVCIPNPYFLHLFFIIINITVIIIIIIIIIIITIIIFIIIFIIIIILLFVEDNSILSLASFLAFSKH